MEKRQKRKTRTENNRRWSSGGVVVDQRRWRVEGSWRQRIRFSGWGDWVKRGWASVGQVKGRVKIFLNR